MPISCLYNSDLLEQVANNDARAFHQLFDKYRDHIYKVAFTFTKSVPIAEEMTQDVFVKVWQHRAELAEITNFEGWLFTIARNHIYNELRKKVREKTFANHLLEYFKGLADTPEQSLIRKESEGLLNKAVAQLPPQQKKIYELSRGEGKNQQQIAGMLGLSKLTVKTHMHHALQNIKGYLQKYSGGALFSICSCILAILKG